MIDSQRAKGLLSLFLGSVLFILFAGKFLLQIIALFVSLALINYGMTSCGYPSLFVFMRQWFYYTNIR